MTQTAPFTADVRDCRLYRFWVEHPVTGEEVLGYIGETVRQPFERLMEHVQTQPWIDTVTRWERDPIIYAGKQKVLEAEAAAIRAERPLYNVKGNEQNRKRIIPPDAIRQRRARDLQRGKPRWVHPDDRGLPQQLPQPMPVRQQSITGRWSPAQIKAGLWSTSWLSTTGLFFAMLEVIVVWQVRLALSAVVSFVLLLWALAGAPVTKAQRAKVRRRRRAARKARRRNKRGRLDLSWITRW